MTITPDTWLISDTHFGHHNIIAYCNRPADCDDLMLRQWHDLVGQDDELLHLGDLGWFRSATPPDLYKRIASCPGKRFLLRGNHDKKGKPFFANLGFELVPPMTVVLDGQRLAFSHRPLPVVERGVKWDLNLHGHVHNNETVPDGYINLSVEVIGYRPWRLRDVLFGAAHLTYHRADGII